MKLETCKCRIAKHYVSSFGKAWVTQSGEQEQSNFIQVKEFSGDLSRRLRDLMNANTNE